MNSFLTFTSKVVDTISISPSVKHITFSVPEGFTFLPGQFVSLLFEHNGNRIRRPYSIASTPGGAIEICVKLIENGPGSTLLCSLNVGDEVEFMGPLGRFVLREIKDCIFVCTGTGVGPFRSMIPGLIEAKKEVTLLAGYRNEEEELYKSEFEKLSEKEGFSYHVILSQPSQEYKGRIGRVQKLVDEFVTSKFKGDIYICGLHDMIAEVGKLLISKGIKREQIIFERYD